MTALALGRLLLLAAAASGCVAHAGTAQRLGPLQSYSPVRPGNCACEFASSDDKIYFASGRDGEKAKVNLDGRDIEVVPKSASRAMTSYHEGEKFERTYAFGETIVKARFTAGRYLGGEEVGENAREGRVVSVQLSLEGDRSTRPIDASGVCGC